MAHLTTLQAPRGQIRRRPPVRCAPAGPRNRSDLRPFAEMMLREMAFVLQATRSVKKAMLANNPCAPAAAG